jgi:cytochrome P450
MPETFPVTPVRPDLDVKSPVRGMPPGPKMPMALQSVGFMVRNVPMMRRAQRKYGSMFEVRLLGFPKFVIISEPELIAQTLREKPNILHAGTGSPLGTVLGANSILAIDEDVHLRQRKLLLRPFHGERMQAYADEVEEIADQVMDDWPLGVAMPTAKSMHLITLRVILRTIFGARGASMTELERELMEFVEVGQRVVLLRFAHRDLGPKSPWGAFVRKREVVDRILFALIDEARIDPELEERADILALLVQATHDDGSPMTDREIRDQLLTLLVAGHETTASTLAWSLERLTRNPEVLARLTESVRAGEAEYLDAVFDETLRIRPTVSLAVRSVQVDEYELGGYLLPCDTRIGCNPALVHHDQRLFPDPDRFDPTRFLAEKPSNSAYIPFGGGIRRCIGSAFARMEYTAVMRRLLERFDLEPTSLPSEPWGFRSITFTPGNGGIVTLRPRS